MRGLVQAYNADPGSFNDVEAEQIALIAKTIGLPFNREVKPIANLLYGAAEGLSFGFAPDSWRPEERGESVYGRSGTNKFFSGAGMVGGGLLGLRAGSAALGAVGKGLKGLGSQARQFYGGARASQAPRLTAPLDDVRGPGFVMNPIASATRAELAGASASAKARSVFNAGYYYSGQVLNKTGETVANMRSGLSSYMG